MCPVARLTRSVNEEKICVFGVAPRPWDEGPLLAHAARSAPTPASTCSPPVPGCSGRTAKGRTRLFRAAFIRALPRALTATWSQPIFPPRAADRVAPRPGLCSQGSRSGRRRSFDHLHFDAIKSMTVFSKCMWSRTRGATASWLSLGDEQSLANCPCLRGAAISLGQRPSSVEAVLCDSRCLQRHSGRASGNLSRTRARPDGSSARHQRRHGGYKLSFPQGPRCPSSPGVGGRFRPGRRQWSNRHSSKSQPERHRGNGWHSSGKLQSCTARLARSITREPTRWLLLFGE